jgi:cholinesterase
MQLGDKISEDCLTLNIWTRPQTGESKKAVLVWIYGGGFTSGSSSSPGTDGQHFVDEEDVVVVSFKYDISSYLAS